MPDTSRPAPEACAVCGEDIPPRARACPACGADERTGWREQSICDGLDLPEETSSSAPAKKSRGPRWITWIILLTLTVILLLSAFGLR